MQSELASLAARNVFGEVQEVPRDKTLVGHRWVFVTKRNSNQEVIRFKARLVAQGFSQKFGTDYEATYSPVMDASSFRFLTAFATNMGLQMQMMDVVTAYLYGTLDKDIYMKVPDGIVPIKEFSNPCVKLKRSLYGLKQSGRMWYQRLSNFLLSKGFVTNDIAPCLFIKRVDKEFVLISVYVDDLNIIGTVNACESASKALSNEFEMKDLGVTTICIGIQFAKVPGGVLMHQEAYTKQILARFNMHDCKPLNTPMVVRKLSITEDPFRPTEEDEEILDMSYPYLSAIGALMYLANQTRPDIAFAVNLLARHSKKPTKRHWIGIKGILRYLKKTEDMGIFFDKKDKSGLVGYADAGYLSDPSTAKSQNGYVFILNGAAISWKSQKQTLVATSTNHAEIIAIYEASRESVWLRSMINWVFDSCGFTKIEKPTPLFEDNAACITQAQDDLLRATGSNILHRSTFMLKKSMVLRSRLLVNSEDNVADIFTKSLGKSLHWKHLHAMGLRSLRTISGRQH